MTTAFYAKSAKIDASSRERWSKIRKDLVLIKRVSLRSLFPNNQLK
jgi:hypothetical protein